jgi:hypothetical protein
MASIYKRDNPDGTKGWRAVVRIKGHPTVCNHFDRKQEADDWSADVERKISEYAQGVIETESQLKGPVLREILSRLTTRPGKIVFVDDRFKQIKSIDDACCELEIPCTAFHYVPLTNTPPLDEKVADYQLSTLVHEHRWVSDSEVRLELEQRMIPFPHFPNKAKYSSLHTPKGRLDYCKKTGKYQHFHHLPR